jgi:UDP-N-acetylmuramate: L-alanyl-gamma-D-glutamyl-meso-diaminopimelate ligase
MLAWILEHWQLRPDYLIGGLARNFDAPARFSGGALAVLEGDEYVTCFDDGDPKFLHYRPEVAAITNVIEDHPDVYRNLDELCDAFTALIRLLPSGGCLIVPEADAMAASLARDAPCPVIAVGYGSAATDRITGERLLRDRSCFRLRGAEFEIPLCGRMNVTNAAMAALAAGHFGIGPARAAEALSRFAGVVNRQEERQIGGIVLVRDKASHPRALVELACAMRQRFPGRRLLSVIQPRATGGRDWIYQRDLPAALAGFDEVILSGSYEHKPQQRPAWAADPFCQDLLAAGLKSLGVDVSVARDAMDLRSSVAGRARGGDVVVLTVLEQAGILVDAVVAGLREGGASAEPSRAPLPQPFGRAS